MNVIKGYLQGREKVVTYWQTVSTVNLQNGLIRDRQAGLKNEANFFQ